MSGFLLDTNCISEVVSIKPAPRVLEWLDAADERILYLSALTLGEIRKGIMTLAAVADRWGLLAAEMKRKGRPMPVIDAMIAATAIHHNLTVVSRNMDDFKNAEVSLLSPWEAV